ncbi:MAG: hypothetical protein U0401_17890 [Anaerolineae bacterium]
MLDRQFDGLDYFEFIDRELEDEFVIRAKISRNSNEVTVTEETAEMVAVKLKDVEFAHGQTWVLKEVAGQEKSVSGRSVPDRMGHADPEQAGAYTWCGLLTDAKEQTDLQTAAVVNHQHCGQDRPEQARGIYGLYRCGPKSKPFSKFLKDVLGWEEFQVRDYESIKNIIALAYFVGGYFYEIDSDLTQNPHY